MAIAKFIRSCIRKIRSVLILAITISLLFYYTFENEIDMLNSYAENESLPSMKGSTISYDESDSAGLDKELINKAGAVTLNLSDPRVLLEKNRYFPLLIPGLSKDPSMLLTGPIFQDSSSHTTHKEKYPVMNEISLPLHFFHVSKDYALIQSSHFEDAGQQQNQILSQIRQLFVKSWKQDMLQKKSYDDEWPLSLIDSLDTLHIMGQLDEFTIALDAISEVDFSTLPTSVEIMDIPDLSSRVLGGLISAFELSKNPLLLNKAKEVADLILRSFDTPNRIPILQYSWKSKLNNRFPYQDSSVGSLTSMALEFIKLSQITRINKYFDAIQRIFQTLSTSDDEFDLQHMFPDHVDASGCALILPEEVVLGKHLRDSTGMKSIDENLQFVHCHQTGKFIPSPLDRLTREQLYTMDADTQSLYANLIKSFHLLNGHDLLRMAKNYHTANGKDSQDPDNVKLKTSEEEEQLHSSKQIFITAMDHVRDLMAFTPLTPLAENLTMISSLKTRSRLVPASNELNVEITKNFDMNYDRCSLAATLALGSKLFGVPDYINFAGNLTQSCFQLVELFDGLYPGDLNLDPCESHQCSFDEEAKMKRIMDGSYNSDNSKQGEIIEDEIKVPQEEDSERPQRILAFGRKQGPSDLNFGPSDVDATSKKWKDALNRPLWANKIGTLSLLPPNVIEAIFYMYRITGEAKWRDMGQDLFKTTLHNLRTLNAGAKGVWSINEIHEDSESLAISAWLSRTLKYYYLLFANAKDYSLDEYVYTSSGHFFLRETISKSPISI